LALGGALVLVSAVRIAFGSPGVPAADQAGTAAPQSAGLAALRVGAISIQVGEVFDDATGGAWAPLAQAANLLHPRTRPSVVRRELLFRTGDRFDAEVLRQTERNLRALGLFRRVEVLTLPPQDGEVGIVVRVFDAWSLTTGTSFRHEGGFSSYDVRFREGNVAGLGVGLSWRQAVGFERRQTEWSFSDPRLLGSRERFSVSLATRSDGDMTEFSLARPFYALGSASGHAVSWRSARERYRTYEDGQTSHEFNLQTADGTFGWAGRMGSVRRGAVWRLAAGYRFVAREYSPIPGSGPGGDSDMPASYRWGGPYLGLQFLQHRFEKTTNILAPSRDVDLNLGLNANADLFVSSRSTGPRAQDRVVAAVSLERGWRLPGLGLGLLTGRLGSERGGGVPARGDISATVRVWVPHSDSHVTAVLCEGRDLLNPDRGVLVYLGGTPGLRGFRENQFAGTRSLLIIVEERKFLSWRLAGFIQPGLAAFAEVGALAGGPGPGAARAVHGDAGVGFRFANAKASGPSVVKVDLAIPIGEAWKGGRAARLVIGFRREL
jgi:hypothetical protein